MKKQPLTREEIACLLRGLGEGTPPAAGLGWAAGIVADPAVAPPLPRGCQQFAAAVAEEFSQTFSCLAAVVPRRGGRPTLGQFLLGCEPSDCLFRVALEGSDQPLWLRLDLPLACSLVERLLGGRLTPQQGPPRALTDLEKRLAMRIVAACARAVGSVWPALRPATPATDVACRVEREWLTSKSALIFCDLQVQLDQLHGTFSLALPAELAGLAPGVQE